MAILGNAVKGSIQDQDNGRVLSEEQLRQLQKILLMMLKDIDSICRKHNLNYILIGGSAIGCVRHKGFIPWDDDVDIAMTRKDYERFRKIIKKNHSDKYDITDAIRENNYGKNIPKLRLKNTVYKTLLEIEAGDEQISADVFIIENVENNAGLKYIHGFLCQVMGFCLSCRRLAEYKDFFAKIYNGKGFRMKTLLGTVLRFASLDQWAHWTESTYSLCRDDNSKYVSVPTDRRHFLGEIFRREVMCRTIESDFCGCRFCIPKQYHYYLSNRYGDYMKVPSADNQVLSVYSKLDFGPYKDFAAKKE